MFRIQLKIALRHLLRHRRFTVLNVVGLSMGVAAALLLWLIVRYELSFDAFYPNQSRIYRLVRSEQSANGSQEFTAGNPLPVAAALKADIPQFEKIVPVFGTLDPQVTVLGNNPNALNSQTKYIESHQGLLLGPDFFQLFPFPWLVGYPQLLTQPNVVVLSEKFAQKYFGHSQQAVGQFLRINNQVTMRVVGVLKDAPPTTDFPLDLVISYTSKQADKWGLFGAGSFDDWGSASSNDQIFVQLPPTFLVESANQLLAQFSRKHYDGRGDNERKTHFLSPLADLHHDERFENFSNRTVPRQRIWNMAIIGGLLVLMACVNFINLSLALATKRTKEVGVRKVLGSQKRQLMTQFLWETFLTVLIALLLGIALAYLSSPWLTKLFDLSLPTTLYFQPRMGVALLALLVLLTGVAGLYPALILSSFSPLVIFQRRLTQTRSAGLTLRQGLIVIQFTAALVLISCTLINWQQMNYLRQLKLGFSKEGVYNFGLDPAYRSRYSLLRHDLLQLPAITSVSFSSDPPSSGNKWQNRFAFRQLSTNEDFGVSMKLADGDYLKTFGLKLVAGSPYAASDTLPKFIVNETLLRKLGIHNPASVIGKPMRLGGWQPAPIVGVVGDFHTNSAREGIQPIVITASDRYYYGGSIRIKSAQLAKTIEDVKRIYARVFPEAAFSGQFYEQRLATYYRAEEQMSSLYTLFAGLTILIACLGLVGLAAFTAEQRTKEIGIRKVLGASVVSVIGLLSKDFMVLVLIAILIASPIGWLVMSHWLAHYAYRIQVSGWVFVWAGLIGVAIALLSVGAHSIQAALQNPVTSLRAE